MRPIFKRPERECIPSTELRKAIQTSPSLRDSLLKFVQAFGVQTTHTAICNAQSRLDVRLARWLLMAHDRIGEDTLRSLTNFYRLCSASAGLASRTLCTPSENKD